VTSEGNYGNPGTLSQLVGEVLQKGHLKLATAESCTGGWVSKTITDTAGSSAWFVCGLATYSDKVKSKLLGVSDITLERYGAVSEETAFEMAEGALYRTEADVALAVTGIAGPAGGSVDKPVGTVCFAWVRRNQRVEALTQQFEGDREAVRWQSVIFALEGLLRYLSPRTEAALKEVAASTYVEPVLVPASAAPVQRKTPFELIDEGKAQLTGLLDSFRIDRNTFVSDVADADGAIDSSVLVAEYRGAVAALSPLKRQSFSQQVCAIGEHVQQACEMDQSAMIGCAHLDGAGAYTVLHPLHLSLIHI
jgi:nicotinamide-nucleotide amidase